MTVPGTSLSPGAPAAACPGRIRPRRW